MWVNLQMWDVIATITAPERIQTTPQSMLWLLPLVAAIAAVYKATKVREIKFGNFLKETVLLFGSIVGFLIIAALALYAAARVILE